MTTTEPQPIASAITWLQGQPSNTGPHPFAGRCKLCEQPLDVLWRQIAHPRTPGWFAVNCCEPCYNAAKTTADRSLDAWLDTCPPEYRQPWDDAKASPTLLRSVLRFDVMARRGLLIVGQSGKAKTRAAWQLMRQLTMDGVPWHFATSLDLMEGLPAEAARAKVLVIDDLGNDPMHGNKEVALLKTIRQRCDWHMPFVVTTQFKGKDLAARFSERATAQAVVRRLREFCEVITAD